jgi:hypothetical protein
VIQVADIINLNKVRKARERALERSRAAENRARQGRSKEQKTREESERKKLREILDQAKRDENS